MKNVYHNLLGELENDRRLVLATILGTKGSAPQIPGASALFSSRGLQAGTLGGGILEGDATRRAAEDLKEGFSRIYKFDLNADITAEEGAICGGTAIVLLDANPGFSQHVFLQMGNSISKGKSGILVTEILGQGEVKIKRSWIEHGKPNGNNSQHELNDVSGEMTTCLEKGNCFYIEQSGTKAVFLEPVYPLPSLIIAGAGHIGKALAHLANLLDFEVTVIDNRNEYANRENIPDADHIIVDNIGEAVRRTPMTRDTYIVIVTRGHHDDADALKACIDQEVPYIGMIGSKKKISLMREKFIAQGWATLDQFGSIHAPVGLEIHSKTVQEIAMSICAQLVLVRNKRKFTDKSSHITAIILAAGESKRMGKPKMLLPFGDASIIEKVVTNATRTTLDKIIVVLGSDSESIGRLLQDYPVETVKNSQYKNGMLSSVQCGLRAVPDTTDAVMVLLGDQPMVEHAVMDQVMEAYKRSDKEIIVATHKNKRGHPILFGSKYIRDVREFPVEKSLKDLLLKYPGDIKEVEIETPEILRDIDTEKDYSEELKHQNNND